MELAFNHIIGFNYARVDDSPGHCILKAVFIEALSIQFDFAFTLDKGEE